MAETGKMIDKVEAGYKSPGTRDRRCGTCSMFRPPRACTLVKGDIYPDDVCDYWEAKS